MIWRCRGRVFDFARGPLIMGIVNVTPDSFSDGGRYLKPAAAVARIRELTALGADLIDLGAESTRPGSAHVAADEQLRRLMPVLEEIGTDTALCISVDTTNAAVAERALAAGAQIVNDVTGLSDPAMAGVVAHSGAGLVVMHMQGTPATMQRRPVYDDVVREVRDHLAGCCARARAAGVAQDALAIDPGIGFGKAIAHNYELLARLEELGEIGRPVLVGVSRKSFLGRELDLAADQRLECGLAATAIAVFHGASIVRTHDITQTIRAVRIAAATRAARRD